MGPGFCLEKGPIVWTQMILGLGILFFNFCAYSYVVVVSDRQSPASVADAHQRCAIGYLTAYFVGYMPFCAFLVASMVTNYFEGMQGYGILSENVGYIFLHSNGFLNACVYSTQCRRERIRQGQDALIPTGVQRHLHWTFNVAFEDATEIHAIQDDSVLTSV